MITREPSDRLRVLIVDDDVVVRMLLEDICREHGWSVVAVATRGDALLAAGLERVDLVLLDFNLGGTDALGIIGQLRTICPTTPIVVVTGQLPEELRGVVTRAGGDGVIGKPCSVGEVTALLDCYRPVSIGPQVRA